VEVEKVVRLSEVPRIRPGAFCCVQPANAKCPNRGLIVQVERKVQGSVGGSRWWCRALDRPALAYITSKPGEPFFTWTVYFGERELRRCSASEARRVAQKGGAA
jgi:hypothetical protein